MVSESNFPERVQEALSRGVLNRLPLTFLPFINQQLHQWNYLFANERGSVERLLVFVAGLSESESAALFRDMLNLEEKMGVRHWQFSTAEQTIQNSSELARSPYFQEWRKAVQAVYDAADQSTTAAKENTQNRIVLLEIPSSLPLPTRDFWRRWKGMGRSIAIDFGKAKPAKNVMQELLIGVKGQDELPSGGLLHEAQKQASATHGNVWVIDAGNELVESIASQQQGAVLLSYARLDRYRENFSHEMNSMRKDLADADAVFDRLRKVDVSPWCPPEVSSDPAVREFVRSLYLSGNGSVIFSNSFVEWASSEAFRRARPTILAARFGVRARPKPFTGVAVFDNPDQVNPLPASDDLEGSAIDAQILSLYVWLAASRYQEYQSSTVCVCIAEDLAQAYVVAPPEFALSDTEPMSLGQLSGALRGWIARA